MYSVLVCMQAIRQRDPVIASGRYLRMDDWMIFSWCRPWWIGVWFWHQWSRLASMVRAFFFFFLHAVILRTQLYTVMYSGYKSWKSFDRLWFSNWKSLVNSRVYAPNNWDWRNQLWNVQTRKSVMDRFDLISKPYLTCLGKSILGLHYALYLCTLWKLHTQYGRHTRVYSVLCTLYSTDVIYIMMGSVQPRDDQNSGSCTLSYCNISRCHCNQLPWVLVQSTPYIPLLHEAAYRITLVQNTPYCYSY